MRSKHYWALSALLFGGCILHGSEDTATERFRFDAGNSPRVVARIEDGSLEIVGRESSELSVNVVKKSRGPSPEAASAMLSKLIVDARQDGDTVHVEVRRGSGWNWDEGNIPFGPRALFADVELRVPRETDLELVTDDGSIVVENVSGRIEAESGDGRLRLRDIHGEIRARTTDGSVVGIGLDGNVDVFTGDGRIELDGHFRRLRAETSDGSVKVRCNAETVSPEEDWYIRSSDGSITLTVPDGLSADLDASTSDGRIVNELRLTESDGDDRWVRGRMGRGGKLIYVKTSDGRITLRSR